MRSPVVIPRARTLMLRTIVLAVALAHASSAGAQAAGAQGVPRTGVIDGVVSDNTLVPLGDVTVSLLGSNVRVVTGSSGRFRVRDLNPGAYVLIVRRIGFEAASLRVQLSPGDTVRPALVLQRAVTTLDTVTVKGQRLAPALQEFEARRKLGEGQFMTQVQIEKRNVAGLSDLLGTFKGIHVDPRGGAVYPLRATGPHDRPCQLQVYLDGIRMPPLDINDYALPKELAGIEVYLGPSTLPLQYKSSSGGGFCGVILLWTRVGS